MVIRKGNKNSTRNMSLKFNGKRLNQCREFKYLGVYLDEKMSFKSHIKFLCEKLSKMCGIFCKLRHCCSKDLLKVIYYALVESHLQYCNLIWGSASPSILEPLRKLQDKIIRIMNFAPRDFFNTPSLYKNLKLLNLSQLNEVSKAKFLHKYKMNKLPPSFENFLVRNTTHRYALRSRETNDFACVWGKTIYGMKKIQFDGVRLWNQIPKDIRNIDSFRDFKKKIKEFFLNRE